MNGKGKTVNRIVRDAEGHSEIQFDVAFKQYRKKPVVVFAALLDEPVEIETLEGTMVGNAGDYLICGVKGEFYPCKPDIFAATYELVGED